MTNSYTASATVFLHPLFLLALTTEEKQQQQRNQILISVDVSFNCNYPKELCKQSFRPLVVQNFSDLTMV